MTDYYIKTNEYELKTRHLLTLRDENDRLKTSLNKWLMNNWFCDMRVAQDMFCHSNSSKHGMHFCMHKPLKWNWLIRPVPHIWSTNANFQPLKGFIHGPSIMPLQPHSAKPNCEDMHFLRELDSHTEPQLLLAISIAGATTANLWQSPQGQIHACL